jgi:WD40 repeat protein
VRQGVACKTLPTALALFSSDGKSIAAILASFSELHTTFTYSPDGSYFAITSRKGVVSFWDANTREPVGQFTAHNGIIVSVAFSPDGRTPASPSRAPGEPVKSWDLAATLAPKPHRKP